MSLAACALLLTLLAHGGAATRLEEAVAESQQQAAGPGGRRLLAVKSGRSDGAAVIESGLPLQEAAAARLCVMQCLQHACISWHKVYMGDAGINSGLQQATSIPAVAADCLLQCGMPEVESGCLAQTYHRLLNTSPLQYSCSSSCVTGLLHSSCGQCSSSGGGCSALHLNAGVAEAECLVDAAV